MDINESNVTILGSTIANNSGGISTEDSTLHMTNSTVTGNGEDGVSTSGQATLQNDTITKNNGSGLDVQGGSASIGNTIFNGNDGNACDVGEASLVSHGGNLSNDATCNPISSDLKNTQAKLGTLASNGGPTQTQLPLSGSPAIDGGVATGCPKTDQRGVARPQDGNHDGKAVCDIGAVEIAGAAAVTTTTAAPVTTAAATTPTTVAAAAATPTTVAAAAELPRTGSTSGPIAWLGACLVAAGGALVWTTRRRRATA
jgi:LPXTG-motif cell wall-anchored protein